MSDQGERFIRAYEGYVHERSEQERLGDQFSLFLPLLASLETTMNNWPIFTDEYAVAQIAQEAIVDAMIADGHSADNCAQFLRSIADAPSVIPRINLDAISTDEGGHA